MGREPRPCLVSSGPAPIGHTRQLPRAPGKGGAKKGKIRLQKYKKTDQCTWAVKVSTPWLIWLPLKPIQCFPDCNSIKQRPTLNYPLEDKRDNYNLCIDVEAASSSGFMFKLSLPACLWHFHWMVLLYTKVSFYYLFHQIRMHTCLQSNIGGKCL